MTEVEKLDAGLEYDFWDAGVNARKLHAIAGCRKLNGIDPADEEAQEAAILELFGTVGTYPSVLPTFNCDSGKNIHVGDEFLANYNVTILDIAPVHIGNHVMIPASNEPSAGACTRIWRMPRGSHTPLLCSVASWMPRCLQRGY